MCKKEVTLDKTKGGCFQSIPEKVEIEMFLRLTDDLKEEYLQEVFYKKGFDEGARNLLTMAEHMANGWLWEDLQITINEI